MVFVDYNIAISGFITDLADRAVAEGWTREEAGYNTIYPAGYAGFKVLLESLYAAAIVYNEGSATTGPFTYIQCRVGATYDAGNHRPNAASNGGFARFRMINVAVDYSASATKKYYVRGLINATTIALDIMADNTCTGWSRHFLFIGEVEKVDAAANTCMALVPEYLTEVGQGTFDATNNPYVIETHFLHVLGDNCSYYPYAYGIGASQESSHVRPSPVLIMRREAGTYKPYQVFYKIPETVLRVAMFAGVETTDDTFVDTDTFQRLAYGGGQTYSYNGGLMWMLVDVSNNSTQIYLASYMGRGTVWVWAA